MAIFAEVTENERMIDRHLCSAVSLRQLSYMFSVATAQKY